MPVLLLPLASLPFCLNLDPLAKGNHCRGVVIESVAELPAPVTYSSLAELVHSGTLRCTHKCTHSYMCAHTHTLLHTHAGGGGVWTSCGMCALGAPASGPGEGFLGPHPPGCSPWLPLGTGSDECRLLAPTVESGGLRQTVTRLSCWLKCL